jgi:hypothetical protein
MARVTYGAIITDLAGSIGGITFQQNASGSIARLKPSIPVNPSLQQSTRQVYLTQLVALWGRLSQANKDAWNSLAAAHRKINDWGREVRVSGYQWFISYNLNALSQGEGPWLTPEVYTTVDPVPQFDLIASEDYFKIDFGTPVAFPGYYAGIYATLPMKQTAIKMRKATYLIWMWPTGNTRYIDITEKYEELTGYSWSDLYNNAEIAIIVRMKNFQEDSGYSSPFTSNIIFLNI